MGETAGQMKNSSDTTAAAAQHVADVNGDIQQLLSGLQNRLTGVDGAWSGTARGAFDNLMIRWNDSARRLNDSLMAISENVKANGVAYAAAQDEHVSALNNAGGSLNLG